jgi:hypothetical protein
MDTGTVSLNSNAEHLGRSLNFDLKEKDDKALPSWEQ